MRQKQLAYFRYNVPVRFARIVKRFLVNRGVAEINHPSHSLDVALVDFSLKSKESLKEEDFRTLRTLRLT